MTISPTEANRSQANGAGARSDELDLKPNVAEVLDRWPSAGLAGGVVRDGSLAWFLGHGVAEIEFEEPVNEDTVFRIGSVSKTFTAIASCSCARRAWWSLTRPPTTTCARCAWP